MRKLPIAAAGMAVALFLPASPAGAVDEINTRRLREAVTVNGILSHERVFQRIANQNDGTRASGTPGYRASVDYVARRLEAAGYEVTLQEFTFPFFRELEPASLVKLSPPPAEEYEVATMEYSGSGDVTGALVPVNDIQIPPGEEPSSSNAGCEPGDFVPAPAEPAVALIQRGTCTFEEKAANAEAAGYDAVVIFNEGQEGRTDILTDVTLGRPFDIPVVGMSFADGAALYAATQQGEVSVNIFTSTETDLEAVTWNVIADSRRGDPEQLLVVGAHLDSVVEGPGINDNGSGTATILEIAEEMAELGIRPRQQVRFTFWGAEENGLLGSEYYIANATDEEIAAHWAYLNFDMVGSTNYVRFVYDGDGSDGPAAGPPGSGEIEAIFTNYFAGQGLASEPTDFDGRSDYGPFIAAGIPAGGLFSGAEGIKTPEQAAIYGGTAGEQYDPCYHEACDDITNVSPQALFELGDAAAHAVLTLARTRTGFFPDGSRVAAAAAAESLEYKGGHAVR